MPHTVIELWHFMSACPAGVFGSFPNLARHGGRLVGTFATPAEARRARREVARRPGFRVFPNGFRSLAATPDREFWRAGFHTGRGGDWAEAGDPSPQQGRAGALIVPPGQALEFAAQDSVWEEQTRHLPRAGRGVPLIWRLDHFKIPGNSHAACPEAGLKRIGLFTTPGRAMAAAAQRRSQDGFRGWPDGFRLAPVHPGRTAWPDGFDPTALEDQSAGRPRKPAVVYRLLHFHAGAGAGIPIAENADMKVIGTFRSAAAARAAIPPFLARPGFSDWPDGFRVLPEAVGSSWWREGFRPGPGGDGAVAGDPSPIRGNDEALYAYPDEMDGREERPGTVAHFLRPGRIARLLWRVSHYKIPAVSIQAYEDMGWKEIGLFAGEAEARAAIADRLGKPGFRDWPGGFRLESVAADGRTAWESGFVSDYAADHQIDLPGWMAGPPPEGSRPRPPSAQPALPPQPPLR